MGRDGRRRLGRAGLVIYGVWRDRCRFIGSTPDRFEAVGLMRDCGLSEDEVRHLLELARPEGWATISTDGGPVTLVTLGG